MGLHPEIYSRNNNDLSVRMDSEAVSTLFPNFQTVKATREGQDMTDSTGGFFADPEFFSHRQT